MTAIARESERLLAIAQGVVPRLPAGLSEREAEVLGLLASGLTNREIAGRLVVSVRTVDAHVATAYRKVGARRRGDAVAFALTHGLAAKPGQDR